jgi:hypothetical protein
MMEYLRIATARVAHGYVGQRAEFPRRATRFLTPQCAIQQREYNSSNDGRICGEREVSLSVASPSPSHPSNFQSFLYVHRN